MWNPTRETRSAMAFSLAAAVALLGSATLLDVRRALQGTAGGSPGAAAPPEILVVAVAVVLLALGVLLIVMA
ncbi:MAG: hypothetical protein EHM13_07850, partial [Acidobacteria bacterium]